MLKRRGLPFALAAAGACLLAASGALAADTFTAALTPTHVQPSKRTAYTLTLTNGTSSSQADRATIRVPEGFAFVAGSATAAASASGECVASNWVPDTDPNRLRLSAPNGSNQQLCPGATLTAVFDATGPATEKKFSWEVSLRYDEEDQDTTVDVVVDGTPPKATVAPPPPALTNSRSATFTFSADEPSSFACELDGGGFQPCASPASYEGLGDGAHTFSVRPTDAAGNTGAATSVGWTIDATAPETALGSAPRSGTTAVSATFTFSASEPATFECKLDGAAFAPCTSPRSYAGLSRRVHSFEVRAIDAAANVEPAAAVHRWTIAAPRRAKATSALLTPQAGARVTAPPLLAWRRAPRATYYNVQLYRGSVKVLSAWPVRTRLQLRSRWTYLRRPRKLSPGVYRWYVWPGYGRAAASRYGRLLGQSTFRVASR